MKILNNNFLFCLVVGVFMLPYQKSAAQSFSKEFKVLSYNIQAGQSASLKELADFISDQNPDLVALQEVDSRTYREGAPQQNGKDLATELGLYTKMFSVYGKTIPFKKGYYGIAILSKYPIAKFERVYLPKTKNGNEQRALLVAKIEYKNGKYLTFACTHLDYTNSQERQVQIAKINQLLSQKKDPVIIAGDFNAEPDTQEISEGMKNYNAHFNAKNPTFSTERPTTRIDYIFSYPKDRWKAVSDTTYNKIHLSDHLPIGATLKFQQK